jgi:hypothetical protein
MQSIVWQDKTSGALYIYKPSYPKQRSFFEQKRSARIAAALAELKHTGNINIYLYKRGRLRLIATRFM